MFEFFEENPERMNRFKEAMSFLQKFPGLQNSYVLKGFDWASLGDGLVVDVGGSHGLVSQDIAREFPLFASSCRTFRKSLRMPRRRCLQN